MVLMISIFILFLPIVSMAKPLAADQGVVELWESIRPLGTISSIMNTCAHPDDEHSATLAYTSLGLGVDSSIVSVTRGQGGQNEIGPELEDVLSVLRTREYQEAAKVLNTKLEVLRRDIDEPLFDFGFSKTWEEALEKWDEDLVLERLVRSIRENRPDVIFPAFLNVRTTHGHHQAINVLTKKAYEAAQDPNIYPEHLHEGLKPWKIKKFYEPGSKDEHTTIVPVGEYDKIYGASYIQLGEKSRYMHRCQGMGRDYEEGPSYRYYTLLNFENVKDDTLFKGVAFTFEDLAKDVGDKDISKAILTLGKDAKKIEEAFPNFEKVNINVHSMIDNVRKTMELVRESSVKNEIKDDILHRLDRKLEQLYHASKVSASLVIRVVPESYEVTKGQTINTVVKIYNGGNTDIQSLDIQLKLPDGWKIVEKTAPRKNLKNQETAIFEFSVTVPKDAKTFHPYLENIMKASVTYEIHGVQAEVIIEPDKYLAVLPDFSVTPNPGATILNSLNPQKPIPVSITLRNNNNSASKASVSLEIPKGWTVNPPSAEVTFSAKDEIQSASFIITPSSKVENGIYNIKVKATGGSSTSSESVQIIEYSHIGRTYFVQDSSIQIQAFDLKYDEDLKIGYVSSGFDETDGFLRLIGLDVTNLTANDLESGDLSKYDTIVLGIRSYLSRPDLVNSNNRLLDYVKNGGNLLVQYNKAEDNWKSDLAPYPLEIGIPVINWRVTDENSKVTLINPEHRFFNYPNKIGEKDWNNWVQDRAAYNPSKVDDRYERLISTGDPGEDEFVTTIITTQYGKGTYTYSSLAWYRQIPNLVPGAYRIFINLLHK